MNPSSLREICAKAMPGPLSRLRVISEEQAARLALSQLHARFSPETALAVYEALEPFARDIPFGPNDAYMEIQVTFKQMRAAYKAMTLLDGRTQP